MKRMKRIVCSIFHIERYFKDGYWPYYNTCTKCGLDWSMGEPCPPIDGPVFDDAYREYKRKREAAAFNIVWGEYDK